jgi:hypothetical protein
MMHSRVAVAIITLSIGVFAQTPHGSAYFCLPRPKDKSPFLSLMAVKQASSTLQSGFDLGRLIPPPEFRHHDIIKARAVRPGTSIWPPPPPLWLAERCEITHNDPQRSIH